MKVFITGGSGFIGKNLVEYLGQRHHIIAPAHKELDLMDEDAVRFFFQKNEPEIVIHSAAKPGHRNAKDLNNILYCNTRMFFNIIRNCGQFKKLIYLGSGLEYDIRYYKPKMMEEYFDTHVPIDDAGFSKYICSKIIEQSQNMIELRLFGVFGKYEDYAIRFISNAICKTLFNLPVTIRQNRFFDYMYIDDLMPVIDYFIENNVSYKCYNTTPDKSIDLFTLTNIVLKISGMELPIIVAEDGLGTEYSGNNSRLSKEIPKLSFTPIEDAIVKLYDWYSINKNHIDERVLYIDK